MRPTLTAVALITATSLGALAVWRAQSGAAGPQPAAEAPAPPAAPPPGRRRRPCRSPR